jgi:cyclomaltodextrinase / maltogenic alpha-amylase / neopullulanase
MTLAGVPSVYYGDEQAFRGIKEDRAGGDDAIRPALPDRPDLLAPTGWPVYRLHQDLIGLRRRNPWLHSARTRIGQLTNRALSYVSEGGGQRLEVALNLDEGPLSVPDAGPVSRLMGPARHHEGTVTVDGHGWAVWQRAD